MRFTSGLPETLCGAGSTLANTEHLRAHLVEVLHRLDVKTLLDAPCGDFNWMAQVDLGGIEYIGADYSVENLVIAKNRQASGTFIELDIVREDLPDADAMLCRDFYQHLPNQMVFAALRNFLASGISWLLATTHEGKSNSDIAFAGMFRHINLCLPPFNFPEPSILIADPPGSGHFLGAWSRSEVLGSMPPC